MKELLPFPPEQEVKVRRQVRAALAAVVPPQHVDLIVDLAIHGVQASLRTLERICDSTANPEHFVAAISLALGLLAGRCEMLTDELDRYAQANGMPSARSAVRLGGGA